MGSKLKPPKLSAELLDPVRLIAPSVGDLGLPDPLADYFEEPEVPDLSAPPPPVSLDDFGGEADDFLAEEEETARRRGRGGRAGTILTSKLGVPGAASVRRPTILG